MSLCFCMLPYRHCKHDGTRQLFLDLCYVWVGSILANVFRAKIKMFSSLVALSQMLKGFVPIHCVTFISCLTHPFQVGE